ncbi:ead/Ea22-like family protein [Salmonella enterica]|uniref:Eae protein n=1 Tax=Salmonella enterica TaxID=28901 RepID=UPI0009ACFDAD|nr:Eae protein [Salmonella enterica]EBX3143135.1 ead/Ea22-like family protein [Salmonella enterica subsp. enterica serovar Ealing]EDQ3649977.1 ead/Ea22-like family protein [Salmonella enterica subsp. enterica]EAM3588036.1 ead/Ea22-like family protein [Salmonella enterica]EAN1764992.1 ead/Ea22-like family protein [Salmonella enterica]EAN2308275.1 ead/Ea22-like family protein [Salmonella enterica]
MSDVKIYTATPADLSPPVQSESFCVDMVLASDYRELEAKCAALAAKNAVKQEFIKNCFRVAADGASMDGADILELGERLSLFRRETYQPVLHGYICGREAGEGAVCVMRAPATDAFLAEMRAQAHKEGAYFVANRMLAAWDAGFIDDTAKNAADIARMILTSTEFMADAPEGDFDRSFADGVLEDIAAQLRKGAAL